MHELALTVLDGEFSIHRLGRGDPVPEAVLASDDYWIARTDDELSIVCRSSVEVASRAEDGGWSCLKVRGPLEFTATGILAGVSAALALAQVSVFAVSTYDTDYLFVKTARLGDALEALRIAGYAVQADDRGPEPEGGRTG